MAIHELELDALAYDVDIRRIICATNASESLNARYRRAVRLRDHFPNEQAAMNVLYLVIRSLNRDQQGQGTMGHTLETGPERLRHHLRGRINSAENYTHETRPDPPII